jgi:hypothetical protein
MHNRPSLSDTSPRRLWWSRACPRFSNSIIPVFSVIEPGTISVIVSNVGVFFITFVLRR